MFSSYGTPSVAQPTYEEETNPSTPLTYKINTTPSGFFPLNAATTFVNDVSTRVGHAGADGLALPVHRGLGHLRL